MSVVSSVDFTGTGGDSNVMTLTTAQTATGAKTFNALVTATDLRVNNDKIHIGNDAGTINQGVNSVSIGNLAGQTNQGFDSFALGNESGNDNQGNNCVALGALAGKITQKNNCVAIGPQAGQISQGTTDGIDTGSSVAIGFEAGQTNQKTNSIAIGVGAGQTNQGADSISIGKNTSGTGTSSIAIGNTATTGTGNSSIAIGNAATTATYANSVAIGAFALSTAPNQITLGTTSETIRLNTITPLYSTIPTFTSGQIGYTLTATLNTGVQSGLFTVGTISIPTEGVYLSCFDVQFNTAGAPTALFPFLGGTGVSAIRFPMTAIVNGSTFNNYYANGTQVVRATVSGYTLQMGLSGTTGSIQSLSFFTMTRIA